MTNRWLIGVAPGSSLHGVDAVLVQVQGSGLELSARLVHAIHHPYPRDLVTLIVRLHSGRPVEMKQVSLLHRLMGETLALTARQVADRASFSLQQALGVGCAGQLLWNEPDSRYPSFLESGMAAIVAERTGLTTVSDFRARDLAAGGQGSPLEALADYLLFRHPREQRVVVHLGGVATVVYLPAGGRLQEVVGFEAGPGNVLLDGLLRQLSSGRDLCDPGGKLAVQGRCLEPLLESWLEHPYWQRRPPKSLAPQVFGDAFVAQLVQQARQQQWERNDLLCTVTHLIARVVSAAVRRLAPPRESSSGAIQTGMPDRVLLSGGGVRNGLLWQLLEQHLPGTRLEKTDQHGVPGDFRRALAHAILAALALDGVPANVPGATGASGARLSGSLTPGSPANWARCVAWMAVANPLPQQYRLAG